MSGRFLLLAVVMFLVFVFSVQSVSAYNLQDLVNSLRNFFFPSAQTSIKSGAVGNTMCADSDNGQDYSVQGRCQDGSVDALDSCDASGKLVEWYCSLSSNACTSVTVDCKTINSNLVCSYGTCTGQSTTTTLADICTYYDGYCSRLNLTSPIGILKNCHADSNCDTSPSCQNSPCYYTQSQGCTGCACEITPCPGKTCADAHTCGTSVTTTTAAPTTTTQPGPTTTISPPGPTTTTQPGSTTTTIPTSFSVSCDECFAGSTCYCNISAPCDDGTWNIVNKEGTPLQYSIIQSIPPIKVSFNPNTTGAIQATATCFKPVYNPSRSIATALVKSPFLICTNPCSVNQKCDCVVNGCKDGKFMAILGNTVLKNEAISTETYAASMYPQTTGSIDVEVTCKNPDHADQASILVSGTGPPTTIGPQGKFTGILSCTSTSSGYRCSLDYSNGYGPAYLVFFMSKSTSGEIIDYSDSVQVPTGSGTKDTTFTCSSRSGSYYVSWTAFTDSSLTNPIPGAWPKPDERRQITC